MTIPTPYDIAAILPGVGVFGGVRRFVEVGNEMVRRGHRYTIYHPGGNPPDWIGFDGEVRPLEALGDTRHQVVVCNDPPLYRKFHDIPADVRLFYFVLEGIEDERSIVGGGWTPLANSESMHRYLQRRYRVDAQQVVGGINLDVFRPVKVERDPSKFRVLTFGRVSRRKKGVDIVRRAVESMAGRSARRGGRPVTLVLFDHVGFGNEQDPREVFKSSVECEWHINRSQSELAELYSSCDVFVNAEKKAGWTNTVAEAMACGVPVVCTKSGTLDMARHGETAWVTRFRHPWFFRTGMEALRDDDFLSSHLRDTALAQMERFSWPRVTDRLLGVIASELAGQR
jgi:glycosyltransferase involved in cell wall biosynthesis